jgi:hypothetical protein
MCRFCFRSLLGCCCFLVRACEGERHSLLLTLHITRLHGTSSWPTTLALDHLSHSRHIRSLDNTTLAPGRSLVTHSTKLPSCSHSFTTLVQHTTLITTLALFGVWPSGYGWFGHWTHRHSSIASRWVMGVRRSHSFSLATFGFSTSATLVFSYPRLLHSYLLYSSHSLRCLFTSSVALSVLSITHLIILLVPPSLQVTSFSHSLGYYLPLTSYFISNFLSHSLHVFVTHSHNPPYSHFRIFLDSHSFLQLSAKVPYIFIDTYLT